MNAGEDFATKIVVKTNMPEVLRQELGKPSWTRERVAIGTATDAYQPCEGRYRLTRRCLEALRDADTPVSIVTKSTLILRDRDLLAELAQGPGATVYFTITTLDPDLLAADRAGHPTATASASTVLRRLSERGSPVRRLPGADPARHHRLGRIDRRRGRGREGRMARRRSARRCCGWPRWSRSTTSASSRQTFPDLLPRYERAYAGTNISSDYQTAIERRLARIRERQGFVEDAMQSRRVAAASSMRIAAPESVGPGQLALPL